MLSAEFTLSLVHTQIKILPIQLCKSFAARRTVFLILRSAKNWPRKAWRLFNALDCAENPATVHS